MGVVERIYLGKKAIDEMETQISLQRHIERYGMIRQWCGGVVLDVACGCGYGSYLVAKNPDVESMIGVDNSKDAIKFAQSNFSTSKLQFIQSEIKDFELKADVLISLETIEHLPDPLKLAELAERCQVSKVIVSFPSKKTTHYNFYHFHDFQVIDLERIFRKFTLIEEIDLHRENKILIFER